MKTAALFIVLLLFVSGTGCSDFKKFPLAEVEGNVQCDGKPVAFATVYFVPVQEGGSAIVGKSGKAVTSADGTFRVSTYRPNDGAVIAKHTVRVGTSGSTDPKCPADLSHSKILKTVDVVQGKNTFRIDVPKRHPRKKLMIDDE